jgi:hypothetical protein
MPSPELTNSPGSETPSLPSLPTLPSTSLDADYLYSVVTGPSVTASLNPTYIHFAYGSLRRSLAPCGTKIDACA